MTFSVGLDTSALSPDFKEHALRGIGRYVYELKSFFETHKSPELSVVPFRHEDFAPPGFLNSCIDRLPFGKSTVRQQLLFPLQVSAKHSGRFDILHFPAHMDAPSWSMRRYMVTVLDLIPLVCADIYKADRPSWRFHLARWLEIRAIKGATFLLAISENTANDVTRILGIPRERIAVTPLGVDERFFTETSPQEGLELRKRLSIPDAPIVLYVGGIDQRKNLKGLIEGFKNAQAEVRSKGGVEPILLLVGQVSQDRQYPKLLELIRLHGIKDSVFFSGFLSDEDLRRIYSISSVFFFPSLYEGFGLPPLEAMAAGLPVVSSNTSAMPEVLGNDALMIDPLDTLGAGSAIATILSNEDLARDLSERGRRKARKFSWSSTGELTMKAYEKVHRNGVN